MPPEPPLSALYIPTHKIIPYPKIFEKNPVRPKIVCLKFPFFQKMVQRGSFVLSIFLNGSNDNDVYNESFPEMLDL